MTKKSRVTEDQQKVWGGLPRSVKIGGFSWQFEFVAGLKSEDDLSLYGETDNFSATIRLEVGASFGQARDTVLHEIQHAIFSNTTLHAAKNKKVGLANLNEENIIRTVTPYLLMVLRDNPQLVAWLVKEEEEDG